MKLSSAFLASASVISQQRYPCNGRKAEEVTCDEATWVFSCPMASNSADEIVDAGVKKFWRLYNSFRTFGRLPSYLKGYLQGVYCSSFYGCVLWEHGSSSVDKACVAWRKALRWTWSLPPCSSSKTVEMLHGTPLSIIMMKRFASFERACLSSDNRLVSFLARHSCLNSRSISQMRSVA